MKANMKNKTTKERIIEEYYKKMGEYGILTDSNWINEQKDFYERILPDKLLYKYIAFDDDANLNAKKIQCLQEEKLWYAAHYTLLDKTEFQIQANIYKVARLTNTSVKYVHDILETLRELCDVCCLTDSLREQMWQEYANNHNGICCIFSILDYKNLSPVIYCKKDRADFTNEVIRAIKNPNMNADVKVISTIPFVLKDKQSYGFEQEIRLLSQDIYDSEDDELGGRIDVGKKKEIGYKGTYYSYEYSGLKLDKIILGRNLNDTIKEMIQQMEFSLEEE